MLLRTGPLDKILTLRSNSRTGEDSLMRRIRTSMRGRYASARQTDAEAAVSRRRASLHVTETAGPWRTLAPAGPRLGSR